MNAYTTSSTNSIDNVVRLHPTAGDLLRAVGEGGLQTLEIVANSEDAFSPSLKAAVTDTLAIIGITKVCTAAQAILLHLSDVEK